MGTAITYLPPGAASNAQLDKYQHFASCKSQPVSARQVGDDIESPGISFADYSRMSTQQHGLAACRRLDTPVWSINDRLLRALLVRYVEVRAGFRGPQPGTEMERLVRAQAKLDATMSPVLIGAIDKLSKEYVELKNRTPHTRADVVCLRGIEQQIESIDTSLVVNQNIAAKVLGVVHFYYKMGFDSVATAAEVGIKPPHCRQICWRLRKTWALLEKENPELAAYAKTIEPPQHEKRKARAPRARVESHIARKQQTKRPEVERLIREGNLTVGQVARQAHTTWKFVQEVCDELGIPKPLKERRATAESGDPVTLHGKYGETYKGEKNVLTKNVGDVLTTDEVKAIDPVNDNGHVTHTTVYGGTIAYFGGMVGAIAPDETLPKTHPGQANIVRVHVSDCAAGYTPQAGDAVKFLLNHTSAGDNVARLVTKDI